MPGGNKKVTHTYMNVYFCREGRLSYMSEKEMSFYSKRRNSEKFPRLNNVSQYT